MHNLFCTQCNKMFQKVRINKNNFCSTKCSSRWHYLNNLEKITEQIKLWQENNKEKVRKAGRKYDKKRNRAEYMRNRRKNDINIKLAHNLRVQLRRTVKINKKDSALELVGCNLEQLKSHLENQFTEGMNWDNYAYKGWHIDHIIPCSAFDLSDPEQQKKCFHYTNLQPLWWYDNLSKSDFVN